MRQLSAFILILWLPVAIAQSHSTQLREIMEADQRDRQGGVTQERWQEVKSADEARRGKVLELLRTGQVKTDEDFVNAALIFQHGGTTEHYRLAHSLATIATSINPSNKFAKWLAAAAWDRTMLSMKRPQWYGTQFARSASTGRMELYTVDESAVSDADREAAGVPSLTEAKAKAERIR